MSLTLNAWLSVPETWRPSCIVPSICWPFVFHHIRPTMHKVELAEYSGAHRNGARIIAPKQVSMISGIKPGFFECVTIISPHIDRARRFDGNEYSEFLKNGQAAVWYLADANLFQGPWEAFNGPNPISIV